ncbi:substrate-binding periplasmic protein [Undibacterium terreum]|uniref:Amino acid ABC transporter substrate-binding protein n=1 Tax=Undibacterium terreum TaxID=1224302 RepID=A0A916XQ21_9BURK|nr:ABC transporter substrate-binding protein [Undibacterium terreum]GGC94695.1 amino acid ABC transporter substrate-binding protein [Undibacterium terreum]
MNSSRLLQFVLAASLATPVHAISLTTEDYPPFNIVSPKNGEISGISTEKVMELMRRAGEKYTIAAYPWARSIQMAQNNPETCVFSTSRTPGRESLYKWVGPLVRNNWVIFARADDTRRPRTLEDLRPYVIGTYRNDAIAEYFSLKGFNTDLASADVDNPRKMLYGRFDFWATGELLGMDILRQQGLSKLIVPLFVFNQTDMYLACNTGMEQARIDHLNHLLKEMDKDGTSAAIEKKYK